MDVPHSTFTATHQSYLADFQFDTTDIRRMQIVSRAVEDARELANEIRSTPLNLDRLLDLRELFALSGATLRASSKLILNFETFARRIYSFNRQDNEFILLGDIRHYAIVDALLENIDQLESFLQDAGAIIDCTGEVVHILRSSLQVGPRADAEIEAEWEDVQRRYNDSKEIVNEWKKRLMAA